MATSTGHFGDDLNWVYLGDDRLNERLRRIGRALRAQPGASLPTAMKTGSALEGVYRFLSNPRVTADDILAPHHAATAARAQEHAQVRLLHDTTPLEFAGESRKRQLGRLHGKRRGFFAHVTLACTAGELSLPLGVLALTTWMRPEEKRTRPNNPRNSGRNGEFRRWQDQALLASAQLAEGTRAIHIMDAEADAYALMDALSDDRFVIRGTTNRLTYAPQSDESEPLCERAARGEVVLSRKIRLGARKAESTKRGRHEHPPRKERMARLAISASTVELRRTYYMPSDLPATMAVNVVRVAEVDTPAGCVPVQWLLMTNLPIETPEQIAAVVDHYRARWQIEEYFKALKTGCTVEELQLESYDALVNALAIFVPIAAQMLLLRTCNRVSPDAPALTVVSRRQLAILRALGYSNLPAAPTAKDVLYAIARMGGHLKNNGDPGWLTLARGMRDLEMIELGWAAREQM
jgi:Transposase DNA-binding/Transposase DDE domain